MLNEFSWGFREEINFPEIVRRLSRLGNVLNIRVVIVVDSLDEAVAINFERKISELALNISSSNGNVKLITSVKTPDWNRFSQFRGSASPLNLLMDQSWYEPNQNEDPKPFQLTQYNETEKESALNAYSTFYNLSDIPEGSVKHYCKHPFLLRVVSELYANKKQIPCDLSEEALIESWIHKKLDQIDENEEHCRLVLISLAQAIFEESLVKENVTWGVMWQACISSIRKISTISEPKIYNLLESIGFITSQIDHKAIKHYSFYYGPVRDYFVARYSLKLDELSSEQLSIKLPDILNNSILRSALFWHLRKAPSTQIIAVESYIDYRATEYINTYNSLTDYIFPILKEFLPPYTSGKVGVCYLIIEDSLEYGLFPITKENNNIVVKLKYSSFDQKNDDEAQKELSKLQAIDYQGGGAGFLYKDPKLAAAKRVLRKVNEAIKKGTLNESTNETILQESILAIISNKKFLHKNNKLYKNMQQDLPIILEEVYKQVQVVFGRNHYKREWENEVINTHREVNPNQTSFSLQPMPMNLMKEIDELVLKKVSSGESFPPPNNIYEKELMVISSRLKQLLHFKNTISKSILPLPDLDMKPWEIQELSNYSNNALIQYITIFFVKAFDAYKDIVKFNFSKISHKFYFYNRLPLNIFVQIKGKHLLYSYQNGVNKTKVVVKINPEVPLFTFLNGDFLIDGIKSPREYTVSTDIDGVFLPRGGPGFDQESSSFAALMPIRTFIYDLIRTDIENIKVEDLLAELDLI